MATKKQIIDYIATTIEDEGLNTAKEVRSVLYSNELSLLNSIYPDTIIDTELTQNIFKKYTDYNGTYEVRVVKIGRVVFLTGFLIRGSKSITIFETENPEFISEQGVVYPASVMEEQGEVSSNSRLWVYSENGKMSFNDLSTNTGEKTFFNVFYSVAN